MAEPLLTDPREMREAIRKLSYGRADIHGNELGPMKIAMGESLVRNCMEHARYAGLSGEDLYTLIAYHALVMVESMGAQLIEHAMLRPTYCVVEEK